MLRTYPKRWAVSAVLFSAPIPAASLLLSARLANPIIATAYGGRQVLSSARSDLMVSALASPLLG